MLEVVVAEAKSDRHRLNMMSRLICKLKIESERKTKIQSELSEF
jgi:hypothetical protein